MANNYTFKIAQLRKQLKQSLSNIKKPFMTYHDGYQYFEKEFNLDNTGFITASELQPSARRISQLKSLIKEKKVECIFYDAPTKPSIMKSLQANSNAKAVMLDPAGILITPGKNAWFELMSLMAKQFISCQEHL